MPFEEIVAEQMRWSTFVSSLTLIGLIALLLFAAIIPAAIARRKGYSFWVSYCFGVVAWHIAIFVVWLLPPKNETMREVVMPTSLKRCINCQTENGADAYFCARCGAAFAAT
jgi:hypothetical protein